MKLYCLKLKEEKWMSTATKTETMVGLTISRIFMETIWALVENVDKYVLSNFNGRSENHEELRLDGELPVFMNSNPVREDDVSEDSSRKRKNENDVFDETSVKDCTEQNFPASINEVSNERTLILLPMRIQKIVSLSYNRYLWKELAYVADLHECFVFQPLIDYSISLIELSWA